MPHAGKLYPFIFRRDLAFPAGAVMNHRAPPKFARTLVNSWSSTTWVGLASTILTSEECQVNDSTGQILWRFLGSRHGHPEIECQIGIDLTNSDPECTWWCRICLDGVCSSILDAIPGRQNYGGDQFWGLSIINVPGVGQARVTAPRYVAATWAELPPWA